MNKIKYSAITYKFTIVISLAILSMACEKEVTNIKVPDFEPKLVVQGFISPDDTTIMIALGRNIPAYGDQTPPGEVKDATVTLSNGDQTVQMVYTKNGEYKVTDKLFVLKHGETCNLTISTPDGLSANATCNIPKLEDWQVTLDTALDYSYDKYNSKYKPYGFKITDTPGEKNYFRVNALVDKYITGIHKWFFDSMGVQIPRIDTAHYHHHGYTEFKNDLLTDWGVDGKILEAITDGYFKYDYYGIGDDHIDSIIVKFYLYHIDYDYYSYHKTFSNYVPDDDPFGEPAPIHSNINGGLGIFCSYAKKEYRFRIE